MSSTPDHPVQLFSRIEFSCICNMLEVLAPTYVVDGPHVEHLKDARRANVEPTDAQAKWQHACQNSNIFCMWFKTMYWRGYLQQNLWPVHSIDKKYCARPHFNQFPTAVPRLICIIFENEHPKYPAGSCRLPCVRCQSTRQILTMQNQDPAKIVSPGGTFVEILERDRAHKWLGLW